MKWPGMMQQVIATLSPSFAAGLEVMLKTRLAIEHWTLLFEDPARAKLSELKSGEFVSVSASKMVSRLNNVASLDLKHKAPDKVFKLRNRVVHFAPPSDLAFRELEHFRTNRLDSLTGVLGTHRTVVECPDCNQPTLVIQGDNDEDNGLFGTVSCELDAFVSGRPGCQSP